MNSPGSNHALALRSDGTLVAWGNNDYGQLKLPAGQYSDIAAGNDFSLALDFDGTIYAAGLDTAGQVTNRPLGSGFIAVDAGDGVAAAVDKAGYIHVWGRPLSGVRAPIGNGYTDISLGKDTAFALHESAPELPGTGPISPSGSKLRASLPGEILIPPGSGIEHTHNGVTRAFDATGKQLFWINDKNATMIAFPDGSVLPVTGLHFVPSGSAINSTENYRVMVTDPASGRTAGTPSPILEISTDSPFDTPDGSVNGTLPGAICFADTGCSVGVTAKQQVLLSDPRTMSTSDIPVFSVHQVSNTSWVGTLSMLGSTDAADSQSITMEKLNVDPDQAINFSVISGKWGNETGTNVVLSAKANLTNQSSVLHYTITGTASGSIPGMNITPDIWKKTDTGDVLVFAGAPETCSAAMTCVATGNYTPADASTYFANATVLYTLPTTVEGVAGTQKYAIASASAGASNVDYEAIIFGVDSFEGGCVKDCIAGTCNGNLKGTSMAGSYWTSLTGDSHWDSSPSESKNEEQCAYEADWKSGYSSRTKHIENYKLAAFFGHGSTDESIADDKKHGFTIFCNTDNTITTSDRVYHLTPFNSSFGSGNKLKYVIFGSCLALKEKSGDVEMWKKWQSSFNGIHMILGFDTVMGDSSQWAQKVGNLMTGRSETQISMVESWRKACKQKQSSDKKAAAIYDSGYASEFLPPYGNSVSSTGTIKYDPMPCGNSIDSIKDIENKISLEKNLSPRIEGKYILQSSLPEIPERIKIYSPVKSVITKDRAALLADHLNLNKNEIVEDGKYYKIISDAFIFEINKENGNIYYWNTNRSAGTGIDLLENLPSDVDAMIKVKHFLNDTHLMPPTSEIYGEGTNHIQVKQVTPQGETSVAREYIEVFFKRQIDTIPLENTEIAVDIGANGDIVGLLTNWRGYVPSKEDVLKNPENAYTEFKKVDLHTHIENPDKVIVTNFGLRYYGQLAGDDLNYLQPVYVFKGYVQKDGTEVNFSQTEYATEDRLNAIST